MAGDESPKVRAEPVVTVEPLKASDTTTIVAIPKSLLARERRAPTAIRFAVLKISSSSVDVPIWNTPTKP
jgi:hypothetical protein